MFTVKNFFSASPFLIHLLNLFRVPLKNTFNAYCAHSIEHKVDELLANDENIINVIQVLQGIDFSMYK